MNYRELLKKAEKIASKEKKEKTALKSLLLFASNLSATEIYTKLNEEVSEDIYLKFMSLVEKYTKENIPSQYLIGYTYFCGHKILVNEDTLIPRWETEELCENILYLYDEYFKGEKVDVLDLGTGSGAIAIALASEEPNMTVSMTDISAGAIEMARKSASLNGASIKSYVGDLFAPLEGQKFDIIVSNPPYLMTNEEIEAIVKDNEPDVALFGGEDGLYFYNLILRDLEKYTKDKYIVGFEHGKDQKEAINSLINKYIKDVKIINLKDSNNLDRMTIIIKE